jgi:hypothetical protein
MPSHDRLVQTAMVLRAESPHGWESFVMAMREFAAATTTEILRCPPEMLQRAQGMALAANELAQVLNEAPKLHDKMQQASIGRPHNGRREQPANR